jgi:hypothetical protein
MGFFYSLNDEAQARRDSGANGRRLPMRYLASLAARY